MRSLPVKCWLSALMAVAGLSMSWTAQAVTPAKPADTARTASSGSSQFVDGIAAVVNKQVITLRQVNEEADVVREQMKRQKIPVPPLEVLQRQVLQRLINQEIERQEAERLGIRVTDEQLAEAVKAIAQRNNLTEARLRQEIERTGIAWNSYLSSLKLDIRRDLIRQRAVDPRINITDAEVDAFLRSQAARANAPQAAAMRAPAAAAQVQTAAATGPAVLGLAQILVVVPENATPTQLRVLRAKAESLLALVQSGADFAGVAAASSDGPEALEGGSLGVRPEEGWPDLFLDATRALKQGQTTGIVQSGNGFHILKVVTRGEPAPAGQNRSAPPPNVPAAAPQPVQASGPMMVTQTRARHILVKTSQVMSSEQARTRLEGLRQRLLNGEAFEDLAKRHSEDSTAPLGGDLGWLSPGETVPPFQRAMDALQPGEISEPVESQFGWHLIEVVDRRTQDMADEYRRVQARQTLFERRVEPAFDDWLNRTRGQAYIDNRLDPAASNRIIRR